MELFEIDAVDRELAKMVHTFRQKLLALPSKIAPISHKQKTVAATRRLLGQGIHEAMNELGSYDPKSGKTKPSRATKKN